MLRNSLIALSTPRSLGSLQKTSTLVARLSATDNAKNSTHNAKWVNNKLMGKTITRTPLEVFPEQPFPFNIIFPDTVVLKVPTAFKTLSSNGKETYKAKDAIGISRYISSKLGVVGTFSNITPIGNGIAHQEFYLSTCNIPLPVVYQFCKEVLEGKHLYEGLPIKFVRVDVTSNIPVAVRPGNSGNDSIGEYKSNGQYVGETCHSYVVREGVETKYYDKFKYMLEVGRVADGIGDNVPNILDSNQTNIKQAFLSPLFQSQGFGRVETRYFDLPSLEELTEEHLRLARQLVKQHGQATSLQDSWSTFLQPGHSQTLVVNHNIDTNQVLWSFGRWVNNQTDKVNGFSGIGEDSAIAALKHRSMGLYPVNIYYCETRDKKCAITHTGVLLPDTLHTAMLRGIDGSKVSKASVCTSRYSWEAVGLSLPFSLAYRNGKGRNLKFRGEADVPLEAPIPESLESQKTIERKAKQAEAKRAKREVEALQKAVAQVAKDKFINIPSDWRQHNHIAKLAEVAKPICTKYEFLADSKYPCWMVLVGKKWYKANAKLGRLLEAKPVLPLVVNVWDGGGTFNGSKVWEVSIKPIG
jgi:hypothetical protein